MCLISIAGVGLNKYSEEFKSAVKHGVSTQDDGTGFAYWKHGSKTVHYEKGFIPEINADGKWYTNTDQNFKDIWARLEELKLSEKDILIIHHRTSTSGKDPAKNCHPFTINTSAGTEMSDIVHLKGRTSEGVLFHNGVFGKFNDRIHEYNDTARVTHLLFSNCPENFNLLKRDKDKFDDLFGHLMSGSNRVVILTPGKMYFLGMTFVTTASGYMHSNSDYKSCSLYKDVGGKQVYTGTASRTNYGASSNTRDYTNYGRVLPRKTSGYGYAEFGYDEEDLQDWEDGRGDFRENPLKALNSYDDKFDMDNDSPFMVEGDFEKEMNEIDWPEPTPVVSTVTLPEKKEIKVVSPEDKISIDNVRKLMKISQTVFNDLLTKLILLKPEVAKDMLFFSKNVDNDPIMFQCKNFDMTLNTVVLDSYKYSSSSITKCYAPVLTLDTHNIIPHPDKFSLYQTYLYLANEHKVNTVSGKAFKYLDQIIRTKNITGLIKIHKPISAKLDIAGIRLFLEVWKKGGLASKLADESRKSRQLELMVN